jgi:hypothetical protein
MLKTSGNTAYRTLAHKHAKMFQSSVKLASEPVVVAKTILKAVMAENPKTRYATGGGAKTILFARRILSDRLFDRLMLSMMK